jgi:Cu(I)/Ag(I) efflux system membrane fusion protein/cobalt-zinc-cadmium efflux system membrane fusion protein
MTPPEREQKHPVRTWLGRLAWIAGGFLLAWMLLLDPWGWHSLNERFAGRGAVQAAHEEAAGVELWTCPMHPHILEESLGVCPICNMDLVPVETEEVASSGSGSSSGEILFYRNPMDPSVTSPVPMKDEMGMDYVPVYADEAAETGAEGGPTVRIDPVVVQNMNVRTAPVERRDLLREIRSVGTLEYDQERMVTVTTKYSGFVEKVYVNYVGEPVRRGQPLFEVYSPELLQTEEELLSALEYARRLEGAPEEARRRAEALAEAARRRLGLWDISEAQIARLEETGEVFRTLTVQAPAGGVVMKRLDGLEGMAVRPGMEIFHIADLSTLWLAVELYEDQVAWIRPGTEGEVTFSYFPGETFRGAVRYLEPELSERTRTLKVKLAVPNRDGRLRPGMFATVRFRPVGVEQALAVPSMAILRTGERSVVVVDRGEGRFEARPVELGQESESWVQVLSGLEEGERVVTSAQFLLDSEASLQEAVQKMMARRSGAEGHQGH